MAMKATNQKILAGGGNNNLSFKDIIVDLKPDSRTGKTTRKLRLIGEPIIYMEYSARTRDTKNLDDKGRPTIKVLPFPDADLKKSITRIGHDDPEQCYWAQNGYIGSKKYAQNCLERQEDSTFLVKILNKGATVFKPLAEHENGSLQEREEDGVEDACTFLGGRTAHDIRVTCHKDSQAPGGVKYEVHVGKKQSIITDEEIQALAESYTPSAEEMKQYRAEYEERMSDDPRLPEFEDFFEYGHNLRAIFKYTPPADSEPSSANSNDDEEEERPAKTKASTKASAKAIVVEDEDEDSDATAKSGAKSSPQSAPKTNNVFSNLNSAEDDDDNWDL